jgi:hypothetical protein
MIVAIITFFEQNTAIITVIKGKNPHDYEHKWWLEPGNRCLPNFDQQKEGGENFFYIPGLARLWSMISGVYNCIKNYF